MIIHCKNTLGDGTVLYVDYEVDEPVTPEDETADSADYEAALAELGVDV